MKDFIDETVIPAEPALLSEDASALMEDLKAQQSKQSPNDVVETSYSQKRALRNLFKNKKNLLSVNALANDIYQEIATEVSQMVNNYNPENE